MVNNALELNQLEHALRFEKQLAVTPDDLYGGEAENWPGEGDRFPAEGNADFAEGVEHYTDVAVNGTQFQGFKQKTAELPTISAIAIKGYVQGLERLLLAGLGYASVAGPVPDSQNQGFFKHFFAVPPQGKNQRPYTDEESIMAGKTYSPEDIINTYLCVSQKQAPYALHARNIAIKDFELTCSAKSVLQITGSGPCDRIDRETSKSSVANWTWAEGSFPQSVFQLSDFKVYLGPAFDGEPTMSHSVTEFSIKISHGLSDDNVPTGTSNNGLSRAEPMPSGKSTITLDMTIYMHDKSLYKDWQRDETKLQCKMVARRGNYKMAFLFPRIQLVQAQPNFDGASSEALSFEVSWPGSEEEIEAMQNSFANERNGVEWPLTSVLGIIVTSKENRNPMREMEVTEQD